jgi:hypothetical protein
MNHNNEPEGLMKRIYEVITYDVWGNAKDGFEVNQAFLSGTKVKLDPDMTDSQINRSLARQGIKGVKGVEWDGDDFTLYATLKRNGRPQGELRLFK